MHGYRRLVLVLVALLAATACGADTRLGVAPAPAQQAPVAQPAPVQDPGTIDRPTSDPYAGDLSIFEGKKRAENLQIDRVMDLLGIRDGSAVADIGAGSGWFTVRAARRVGPGGVVYAVEINEKYLRHIEDRARKENLTNVKTVLGAEDDPRLPARGVDAVLILKTYHEFSEPVRIMRNIAASLRPGGLVGIIDRDGDGDDHGVGRDVVVQELERAGFVLAGEHDFVKPDKMDYFLVFRAKS